jgi:hypothetical protein
MAYGFNTPGFTTTYYYWWLKVQHPTGWDEQLNSVDKMTDVDVRCTSPCSQYFNRTGPNEYTQG